MFVVCYFLILTCIFFDKINVLYLLYLPRCIHNIRKWFSCYPSEQPVVGRHHFRHCHWDDIEKVIAHFWWYEPRKRNVWIAESPWTMSRHAASEYNIAMQQLKNMSYTTTKQNKDEKGRCWSGDEDRFQTDRVVTFLAKFFVRGPCDWWRCERAWKWVC